jgi:hypothetical protein
MASTTANSFETAGRLTKAFHIAQALFRAGIAADQARLMTYAEWVSTAACAGCKPPSEATQEIAIGKLAEMWAADSVREGDGE